MISWSARWMSGATTTKALCDYNNYRKDPFNDKELVKELWGLFNEADIIIGHNGDKFDIRKTQARMIYHGFKPPSPSQTVDTLKIARKHFAFTSNRLDDLAKHLGVGEKTKIRHGDLWWDCVIKRDVKAWEKMKRYNHRDVVLLEKVYLKMRPWHVTHPNIYSSLNQCPVCSSYNLIKRGFGYTKTGQFPRFRCEDCGKWTRGKIHVSNSLSL